LRDNGGANMCLKTVEIKNIIIAKEEFNNQWIIGELDKTGIGFKWKKYISDEIISDIYNESPHKKFFDRLQRALNVLDIEEA
jgi:hypothetical protein